MSIIRYTSNNPMLNGVYYDTVNGSYIIPLTLELDKYYADRVVQDSQPVQQQTVQWKFHNMRMPAPEEFEGFYRYKDIFGRKSEKSECSAAWDEPKKMLTTNDPLNTLRTLGYTEEAIRHLIDSEEDFVRAGLTGQTPIQNELEKNNIKFELPKKKREPIKQVIQMHKIPMPQQHTQPQQVQQVQFQPIQNSQPYYFGTNARNCDYSYSTHTTLPQTSLNSLYQQSNSSYYQQNSQGNIPWGNRPSMNRLGYTNQPMPGYIYPGMIQQPEYNDFVVNEQTNNDRKYVWDNMPNAELTFWEKVYGDKETEQYYQNHPAPQEPIHKGPFDGYAVGQVYDMYRKSLNDQNIYRQMTDEEIRQAAMNDSSVYENPYYVSKVPDPIKLKNKIQELMNMRQYGVTNQQEVLKPGQYYVMCSDGQKRIFDSHWYIYDVYNNGMDCSDMADRCVPKPRELDNPYLTPYEREYYNVQYNNEKYEYMMKNGKFMEDRYRRDCEREGVEPDEEILLHLYPETPEHFDERLKRFQGIYIDHNMTTDEIMEASNKFALEAQETKIRLQLNELKQRSELIEAGLISNPEDIRFKTIQNKMRQFVRPDMTNEEFIKYGFPTMMRYIQAMNEEDQKMLKRQDVQSQFNQRLFRRELLRQDSKYRSAHGNLPPTLNDEETRKRRDAYFNAITSRYPTAKLPNIDLSDEQGNLSYWETMQKARDNLEREAK